MIGVVHYRSHLAKPLTDKDTIVLSDFDNKTGEPVFDDALKQGLAIQLEQSPFLSLVSEQRIRQTLQLMGQPPETRVTSEIARELCERAGGAAEVEGSIATLGSQYLLALKAVNCRTGDTVGREQSTSEDKGQVLTRWERSPSHFAANSASPSPQFRDTIRRWSRPPLAPLTPSRHTVWDSRRKI